MTLDPKVTQTAMNASDTRGDWLDESVQPLPPLRHLVNRDGPIKRNYGALNAG